jgi:hypothetical protein
VLSKQDVDIKDVPYALRIKNISGYMEPCVFCKDKKCDGCPLPFTEAKTYTDILNDAGITNNSSFFSDSSSLKKGKQEVILEIVWSKMFPKFILDKLQNAKSHPHTKSEGKEVIPKEEAVVTLKDCFEEFKKSEMLDENNKWYCGRCKEHV